MEYDPSPEDYRNFREWLRMVPYLPQNMGDEEFCTFFRCCKGSLEKTKAFIDKFYYARLQFPEILTNFNPLSDGARYDMELAYKFPLPKRAKDGSLIVVTKIRDYDSYFDPYEVFKMCALMFKILVLEGQLQSGKVVFIGDFKEVKFSHIKRMTPQVLATVMTLLNTIFPYRVTGMHAISLPPAAEWMLTLVKTLLKPKLAERIYLHKSYDELLEWYPKEILPVDFGGEEECSEKLGEQFRAKLEGYTPFLLSEEAELQKLDALRPPPDLSSDILVGSFKKLEVD